jgi:Fas apoptotic inhibitory molecule (FAIM1)
MSRRTFHLSLDGRPRQVQVEHGYWTARRVVRVDGVEVLRVEPRSLRERSELWQTSTEHPFVIDSHRLVLRVRPGSLRYDIELVVDGRSPIDGLPAGPLRAPAHGRYSYAWVKAVLAGLPVFVYLLLVLGLFGPVARAFGSPRWVLGAEVAMDLTIPALAVVLVILAWQSERRGRNVAVALVFLALTLGLFRDVFAKGADLVLPLDEERIAFAGWEPAPLDMRRVTFAGGSEVEFANFIKVRYRRLPAGAYVLVRGHFSRLILDMREATAAAN